VCILLDCGVLKRSSPVVQIALKIEVALLRLMKAFQPLLSQLRGVCCSCARACAGFCSSLYTTSPPLYKAAHLFGACAGAGMPGQCCSYLLLREAALSTCETWQVYDGLLFCSAHAGSALQVQYQVGNCNQAIKQIMARNIQCTNIHQMASFRSC
jgi:hypothetical protein